MNTQPGEKTVKPGAPRLLSLKEAARYMSVSYWTVRDWAQAGTIPTVKLPRKGDKRVIRRVLIDVRDLDALIERSKESY